MKKTKTPAAWLEDRLFDFLDYIEETALLVLEAIYLSFLLVWLRVRPYVLFSFRVAFFPLSFAWDLFKKLPAYLRFITYVCAFVLGLVLVLGPKFFTPYLYGDSSAFGDVYSFLNKHIYQDFYKRRDFHSKGNPYFFSLWVFSLLFVPQLVSAALYRSYWLIDFGGDFTQFRPTRRAPIERATSFTFTHLYIFFYSWAAHASSLAYLN